MMMDKSTLYISFEDRVIELVSARPVPEMNERFKIIEDLDQDYYLKTGLNLPSTLLSILADWILIETLNDRSVDKVTNTDFAILSHRQLKRRNKRENSVDGEVMDYLNQKYIKSNSGLSKKVHKDVEY